MNAEREQARKDAIARPGTPGLFDEAKLAREVSKVWGEHGAHMEVLSRLMRDSENLAKINKIIFAAGAPLGSDNYFKIRGLCVDNLKP